MILAALPTAVVTASSCDAEPEAPVPVESRVSAVSESQDEPALEEPVDRPGRRDRLESLFAGMDGETSWAGETEARLGAALVEGFGKSEGQQVVAIDCAGEALCKVVLEHGSEQAARRNNERISSRDLIPWEGAMLSFGESRTRQTLFLLENGYVLDGRSVIKSEGEPAANERPGVRGEE